MDSFTNDEDFRRARLAASDLGEDHLLQPKIAGYRQLAPADAALMNEAKQLEARCLAFLDRLPAADPDVGRRSIALARTNLETGFMWAVRAIARPEPVEIQP